MKTFLHTIFFASIYIIATAGCSKNLTQVENQAILFEYEYVNFAWGYHHSGYIIDGEGNILTYKNPEGWNFPGTDSSLTEVQVSANLAKCTQTGRKIPHEELIKYSKLIKNLSLSEVSAPKNVGADAGSIDFLCYQFSAKTGKFKRCIIKKEGDFTCENLNFFAKRVATWMQGLNDSVSIR